MVLRGSASRSELGGKVKELLRAIVVDGGLR